MNPPNPDEMDLGLRRLLMSGECDWGARFPNISSEDLQFIERILTAINEGSRAVFIHHNDPSDRLQYVLLGTNKAGAIALTARVLQRLAEQGSEK